ncbi:hypothetical protein ACX80O_02425 [Arthrobacter sp. Hz1]
MTHGFHGDAWGMAPGARNWRPPLQVEVPDPAVVHTTNKTMPLWVELNYPDGSSKTEKAFAVAWTDTSVHIQWVENSLARFAWITLGQVSRRQLE